MKVLITHSYFLRFDPKQWDLQQPYAPLGAMYAAAVLRKMNCEVRFHDTMFAEKGDEVIVPLKEQQPDWMIIYDDGFNYLTKMCLTNMREAAFEMIELAKKQGCKVAVSSSDSTDHYEEYLKKGADVVLLGEAEETIEELIKLDIQQQQWHHIKGIASIFENKTICNAKRAVIKDLDKVPFPAWDLIDMAQYKQ